MEDQEISVAETARKLNVTLHHVYSLVWAGRLEARKIGRQWRVSVEAVEARQKGGE